MALRFTVTRILPSLAAYLGLVVAAVAADALLHRAGLASVGRYLGIAGTATILASFLYSARKRALIRQPAPKPLLRAHELMGWSGAVMILVHGGIHANALIPWLALGAMVVVVGSGLTGKFLLKQAREGLKEREAGLKAQGRPADEIERELAAQALLVGTMQRWRKVHMPLTMAFAAFATLHIVSTLLLWSWR